LAQDQSLMLAWKPTPWRPAALTPRPASSYPTMRALFFLLLALLLFAATNPYFEDLKLHQPSAASVSGSSDAGPASAPTTEAPEAFLKGSAVDNRSMASAQKVEVRIGPSKEPRKCVMLPVPVHCRAEAADKGSRTNTDFSESVDSFVVEADGFQVCARRKDDSEAGWGMNLTFLCESSGALRCGPLFKLPVKYRPRFLFGQVSQGLTNQRLALATYHILAAALNRTLVIGPSMSGNNWMCSRASRGTCQQPLPFDWLYNTEVLACRFPPSAPICILDNLSELALMGNASLANEVKQVRGGSLQRLQVTETNVQMYVDRFLREYLQDDMIVLSHDAWADFILGGTHPSFVSYERAFMPASDLIVLAREIVRDIRESQREARLVWLHLRIESDWNNKSVPVGPDCMPNNINSIVSKLQETIANSSAASPGTCGSVPPARSDVLYVAGGDPPDNGSQLHGLFASLRHARQWASVRAMLEQTSRVALPELHPMQAALDFTVGLFADIVILCKCSTFSASMNDLRIMGHGMQGTEATWTWSGPPYPGQRSLEPYMCSPPCAKLSRSMAFFTRDCTF